MKNVRLAFFDINLTSGKEILTDQDLEEIKKNHTSVLNDIAFAIQQFIHPENGPYALIFWTKNVQLIEAIKDYIRDEERGYSNIPSPLFIGCLDKANFNNENIELLSEAVLNLVNSSEKLKFLFDLEENTRIAGENTLNRLYNILPNSDQWGESESLFENLDKVLSKIAASKLGFEYAKTNPRKAIYEGLMPIINYEFLNSQSNVEWEQIVTQLSKANRYSDIVSPDDNIQHKVNTLYHIEAFDNQTKDVRGCVVELDKSNPDLLASFNIKDYSSWFNEMIPIDNNGLRRSLRNTSKLIAIEFSAACDYSNQKKRINKYILGVLTERFDINGNVNKERRIESSYHLGGCCFQYNENNCNIWLNLNFVFGATPNDLRLGQPIFILKKEMMDMLGNKYASHVSRIGITSF
ncbi:MAG: hypothetical protein EOP48_06075 [Sphingobacteriales bacterium]|nr:MAG: hypothetical protein EOP48_06075 [Sphingobacteriales bacterium]